MVAPCEDASRRILKLCERGELKKKIALIEQRTAARTLMLFSNSTQISRNSDAAGPAPHNGFSAAPAEVGNLCAPRPCGLVLQCHRGRNAGTELLSRRNNAVASSTRVAINRTANTAP